MTVTYEGVNTYKIEFGFKTVELNDEEIEQIKNYNFEKGQEIDVTFEEIEKKVDELQERIDDLVFELRRISEERVQEISNMLQKVT